MIIPARKTEIIKSDSDISGSFSVMIGIGLAHSDKLEQIRVLIGIGLMLCCLILWSFVGWFVTWSWLTELSMGELTDTLFIWFGFWLLVEIWLCSILARICFSTEKIIISKATITIGRYILGLGRAKRYDLTKITHIKAISGQEKLQLDIDFQRIHCGKSLNFVEAEQVAKHLTEILTFRCQSVERIIFGASQIPIQESQAIIQNPDVTELTFPFVRLKELIIYPETADFYQIERFLTYAVNYIGQEYLKDHVEVHIYGDPKQLHENLRNNFDNLCKEIYEHQNMLPKNTTTD